jgi:hypothetical protein
MCYQVIFKFKLLGNNITVVIKFVNEIKYDGHNPMTTTFYGVYSEFDMRL